MDEQNDELEPQVETLDPEHLEKFLQDSRDFLELNQDTEV